MNAVQRGEMTQLDFDTYMNSPHYSINFKRRLAGLSPLLPLQPKDNNVDEKIERDKEMLTQSKMDRIEKAKRIVASYILSHLDVTDEVPHFDVYVVWYVFILGNWKALVSTNLPDGMYYEVTHNQASSETYLDAYKKFQNICIKD